MIFYCISGLGADSRVFCRLQLQGEMRHIRWVQPRLQETLQHYAGRLAAQIDTSQPFALLGVSFGGLVARELARLLKPQQLILISSFADVGQLPAARFPFLLPLLKGLPNKMLIPPCGIRAWLFGVVDAADKKLLCQILKDTDPQFLRWSLELLFSSKVLVPFPGLLQLHGSADRLIPCPRGPETMIIKKGGHFIVYTHAPAISRYIQKRLAVL